MCNAPSPHNCYSLSFQIINTVEEYRVVDDGVSCELLYGYWIENISAEFVQETISKKVNMGSRNLYKVFSLIPLVDAVFF